MNKYYEKHLRQLLEFDVYWDRDGKIKVNSLNHDVHNLIECDFMIEVYWPTISHYYKTREGTLFDKNKLVHIETGYYKNDKPIMAWIHNTDDDGDWLVIEWMQIFWDDWFQASYEAYWHDGNDKEIVDYAKANLLGPYKPKEPEWQQGTLL